jgi:hypothetical protein
MADLRVPIDNKLLAQLKAEAALAQKPLKAYVIELLRKRKPAA